jgi:hypothetical protein
MVTELDVISSQEKESAKAFARRRLDAVASWKDAQAVSLKQRIIKCMPELGIPKPDSDTVARITAALLNSRKLKVRKCGRDQYYDV